jgi:hypothetical protein
MRYTATWQAPSDSLFTLEDDAMRIFGVRHRSEAYR